MTLGCFGISGPTSDYNDTVELTAEQTEILSRITGRLLNMRAGTAANPYRKSLGPKRKVIDLLLATSLLRTVGNMYVPTFRGVQQLDEGIRRIVESSLTSVLRGLQQLYKSDDRTTIGFNVVVEVTKRANPTLDQYDVLPALILGEELGFYHFPHNVRVDSKVEEDVAGDDCRLTVDEVTVHEDILDFTSVEERWKQILVQEARWKNGARLAPDADYLGTDAIAEETDGSGIVRSYSLRNQDSASRRPRSIAANKAVAILTTLVHDAPHLENEPFGSPKRDQWVTTAQAALERAFEADSSVLSSFETAQSSSFSIYDSDSEIQKRANAQTASMVAILRSAIEQLRWDIEDEDAKEVVAMVSSNVNGVTVFISHSSRDADLAQALVELLRAALGIAADQIRCSSVDGYRLPVGVSTESKLREEVNAAKVVVGLITPSSLASSYVMFELGARWGTGLFLAPLLAGVEPRTLSGPLSLLNALSASNDAQLHQLLADIANQLGFRLQNAASYVHHISRVRQLADAAPQP
jgi:hypothetical protein